MTTLKEGIIAYRDGLLEKLKQIQLEKTRLTKEEAEIKKKIEELEGDLSK